MNIPILQDPSSETLEEILFYQFTGIIPPEYTSINNSIPVNIITDTSVTQQLGQQTRAY